MAFNPLKPKPSPFQQPKSPGDSGGFSDGQGKSKVGGSEGQGQSVVGSGGSGGANRAREAEAQRVAQVEASRQAEIARQKAEADALRIQQEQAKLEQQKIENLRRAILEKGAQERETIRRNADNQRIRTTTTEINRIQNGRSTNALVWKYENLDTGEVRYRSYEKPKGGGGRVLSGGVDVQLQTKQESSNIQNELKDAGLKPIVKDGQVIGFSSNETAKTYRYNNKGLEEYNRQVKMLNEKVSVRQLTPKISYGSFYKNIDAKLKGILPGGVTKQEIQSAKKAAEELLKENLPVGTTRSKVLDGNNRRTASYVITFSKKKDGIGITLTNLAIRGDAAIGKGASAVKNTVSNLLKRTGINVKDTRVANYVAKVASNLKDRGINNVIKLRDFVEKENKKIRENYLVDVAKKQRQRISEVEKVIRQNPNLTDEQIRKKLYRETSKDTLKTASRYVVNLGGYISSTVIKTALNLGIATPQLINQIRKNPLITLAALPPLILEGMKQDLRRVRTGGFLTWPEIVIEYSTFSKVLKVGGAGAKATTQAVMKVLPGTKKVVNGRILVKKVPAEIFKVRGKERLLKQRVKAPSFKRPIQTIVDKVKGRKPGQFRKFTKDKGLELKFQTVKSGSMNFAKQFKEFSGRQVQAVNASAQQLTSLLRRRKIIRKPFNLSGVEKRFPKGEASFPVEIRRLLAKFDAGKRLTTKEFIKVNGWLQKNIASNVTLLERSLYLDPTAGLRVSRLGIQPEGIATLRDIIRGNFKFFGSKNKPQILVFETARVANTPAYIKRIVAKIESKGINYRGFNKDLAQLVEWQTRSGTTLFKPGGSPIYAGGRELEVTLAPGTLIKIVKRLGRVYIDGRKVTIVSAKPYKPSASILKQMRLAELGKLSSSALQKLNNFLSKQLGRKVRVETPQLARTSMKQARRMARRSDPNIPVLRVRGSGVFVLRSGMRGLTSRMGRTPVRVGGRVTGRTARGGRVVGRTTRPGGRPGRNTSRGRVVPRSARATRPTRPITRVGRMGRAGRRGGTSKKPVPVLRLAGFTSKTLPRKVPTYYVVEKVRGKFKKLFPKPLSLQDARDYATYSIDNRLSRTAFFVPLGKSRRVVQPPRNIQGYFSKNSRKFRPYRIRFGQKKALVNGYIEKRKFFRDTPGERRSLRVARRPVARRMVRRVQPRRVQRRINPAQRRELLRRLAKARAVRMRNLRRRR